MTCKDCIHYDMCERMPFTEDIGEECDYFGWKRRFIELPCNAGGKVYICRRKKVKECEVVFIGLSADKRFNHINFVENYEDGTFMKSYSLSFDCIGKDVFLSYEEAEKALNERKLNDTRK